MQCSVLETERAGVQGGMAAENPNQIRDEQHLLDLAMCRLPVEDRGLNGQWEGRNWPMEGQWMEDDTWKEDMEMWIVLRKGKTRAFS